MLAPKAVPSIVKHFDVPKIISCAQNGGKDRQQHKGQPYWGAAALLQFRPQTTQEHCSYLLSHEQRTAYNKKYCRPKKQQNEIHGFRPLPMERRYPGGRVPVHAYQGQKAVVPQGTHRVNAGGKSMERMPKKLPAMPHTKAAAWFKKRRDSPC